MKNTMMNWVKVSIISWQLKHKVTFGEKSSVESGDDNAKSWKFEILKRVFLKKVFFLKKKIRFNFKEVISNHSESVQTEWRYFFCHVVYFITENRYKYTV